MPQCGPQIHMHAHLFDTNKRVLPTSRTHIRTHRHMSICTVTHMYAQSHVRTQSHICTHIHTYVCTITHVYAQSHICTHRHTCVRTVTRTYTQSHVHACTHHMLRAVSSHLAMFSCVIASMCAMWARASAPGTASPPRSQTRPAACLGYKFPEPAPRPLPAYSQSTGTHIRACAVTLDAASSLSMCEQQH